MKSAYSVAAEHILCLSEELSVKETVHVSQLLLHAASSRLKDIRTRRMIDVLAADVQKIEDEVRE